MLKTSLLFLLLCSCLSTALCQQTAHRDSVTKVARADAKNFRLDDDIWKKYRRKLAYTSDYFKPREANVKHTALLSDSVFVDAYRREAFKRNRHRRTPWHYVLVGGGIAAGLAVTGAAMIIIFIGPTMS